MSAAYDINDIAVGDFVVFTRQFTSKDWTTFASLSGDDNPLHWDASYAASTEYGAPIVPLHLAASPLSAIAGSMLPGRRALYLGSRIQALSPLFFDEPITYSARVAAVSAAARTLSLNVIAFRGGQVRLHADMLVRVRDGAATGVTAHTDAAVPLRHRRDQRTVVVTGATGAIGREVIHRMTAMGHPVLAIGRSDAGATLPAGCRFVRADLATDTGRAAAAREVAGLEQIGLLIHLASSRIDAPAADLFGVNFEAFRMLATAALPAMLGAQSGRIMLVGSKAVQTWPAGMETYAAAKAAASAYADFLSRQYRAYGIETLTLAPDYVDTSFSAGVRSDGSQVLHVEEVADAVVDLCEAEAAASSYVLLTQTGSQPGRFGFAGGRDSAASVPTATQVPQTTAASGAETRPPGGDPVARVVREVLRLSADEDLGSQALDVTPGWDSLRHLELMMSVEEATGIRFSSSEIAETRSFPTLAKLVSAKQQRRQD